MHDIHALPLYIYTSISNVLHEMLELKQCPPRKVLNYCIYCTDFMIYDLLTYLSLLSPWPNRPHFPLPHVKTSPESERGKNTNHSVFINNNSTSGFLKPREFYDTKSSFLERSPLRFRMGHHSSRKTHYIS